MMEIVKLDVHGYYFYKPDLQIENYDKYIDKKKLLSECAICKRAILESSYEAITNLEYLNQENKITVGKCGHMFHSECINSWTKTNNICPIDKVAWQTFRVADSQTKLILKSEKKSFNFEDKLNKFSENKSSKYIEPIKNMGKTNPNYAGEDKLFMVHEPENLENVDVQPKQEHVPLQFWFSTPHPVGNSNTQPVFIDDLPDLIPTQDEESVMEDVD
jgi:hypothetical protein